jgi:hypothetical protein
LILCASSRPDAGVERAHFVTAVSRRLQLHPDVVHVELAFLISRGLVAVDVDGGLHVAAGAARA